MRRKRLLILLLAVPAVLLAGVAGTYLALRQRTGDISHPDVPFSAPPPAAVQPKRTVDAFAWPRYGYDKQHTRAYVPPRELRGPWRPVWTYRARALLEFPPVIYRGVTLQLAGDGRLAAITTNTGRVRWRRRLGRLAASTPAVDGGSVYVTILERSRVAKAGRVAALRVSDGGVRWSRPLPSRSESSPLLDGGRLFFGAEDGTLYCLDARSGRVRWTYRAAGPIKGSPTLSGGVLYIGDYGGHVQAVRESDGRQVWSSATAGTLFGSGRFYATPAVAFGRVYIGNTDGREYSFSARSGKLAWARQTGDYVYSSAAVQNVPAVGPTVFFGSYDGRFYALDARSGRTRWTYDSHGKISGSPTIVGGVVYFADLEHFRTVGLSSRTGRPRFGLRRGSFDPVISDGRHLLVTGYDTLTALQASNAPAP